MKVTEYFNKQNFRDLAVSLGALVLSCGAVSGGLTLLKRIDTTQLQQSVNVAGEISQPAVGRLICLLLYLAFSLLCVSGSGMLLQKQPEKLELPWLLSAAGGTLLWASIGECLWHFGATVADSEGTLVFTNFPRLESIQGLPLFLFCALLFAGIHRKASFTLKAYSYTFLGNWLGHLCTMATYPIAMALGSDMDLASFYKLEGAVSAIFMTIIACLLIFGKTKRETKFISSILLYAALGNLVFAIILGEV